VSAYPIRKKQRQRQQRQEKSRTKLVIAWMLSPGRLVAAILGLITVVGTYYLFKARISVEPDTPILAKETIQIPVKITNNSILPVYSLEYDCIIVSIGGGNPGWIVDNSYVRVKDVTPKLESGEPTSIHARFNIVSTDIPVTHGDIVFVVRFTPSIVRWRRLKAINRFEAKIDEDGKLRWYHKLVLSHCLARHLFGNDIREP
jgi:hypothetical protein